jgi:uncharacterized membrane protein YjjB (DUF3815 family)
MQIRFVILPMIVTLLSALSLAFVTDTPWKQAAILSLIGMALSVAGLCARKISDQKMLWIIGSLALIVFIAAVCVRSRTGT